MITETNSRPAHWKFDHIGIVVKSLTKAKDALTKVVGIVEWTAPIDDYVNGVQLMFGRDPSGLVYELLVPLGAESPVASALATRKNILNHTAYLVKNLAASAEYLRSVGCASADQAKPAIAFGGALIQFFVTPLNTVIEIIEAPEHRHIFMFD
jgi:methylmalonyl-CoA/ethylmalonyl-CoA epimerase